MELDQFVFDLQHSLHSLLLALSMAESSITFPFSISRDSFHVWEIGLGIQANKNKVTMIARKRKRNPSEFGFASFNEYAWLINFFS